MAGLASHNLPRSDHAWALAFTWEHWKNSTGTLAPNEEDHHHQSWGLPSCSVKQRPFFLRVFGAMVYTLSLPRGRKGQFCLAVSQHFWGIMLTDNRSEKKGYEKKRRWKKSRQKYLCLCNIYDRLKNYFNLWSSNTSNPWNILLCIHGYICVYIYISWHN